ncbi:hypothetical protein BgiBS90_003200, partial [Biomphalaria glabrata]
MCREENEKSLGQRSSTGGFKSSLLSLLSDGSYGRQPTIQQQKQNEAGGRPEQKMLLVVLV